MAMTFQTEYDHCFIQPVNDSVNRTSEPVHGGYSSRTPIHVHSSSSLLHPSLLQSEPPSKSPYMNKPFRSRSQAISVEKLTQVSNQPSVTSSLQTNRTPMFNKAKKSLVKSQRFVMVLVNLHSYSL